MPIIGKQQEVGFSIEGVRGTAETTVSKWLKNTSVTINPHVEKVIDESSQGRIEDSKQTRVVKKWFEGSINGNIHIDALGYVLKQLYGAVATTTVEADTVYAHVFTINNDIDNDSLSLFIKDGDVNQRVLNGAVVKTFEITAEPDEYVKFSLELSARDEAVDTNTPSYDTEYEFIAKDITVKIADTEVGLVSATAVGTKSLSLKWDAGSIVDHTFGSYTPDDIYNSKMSLEGSVEKNYADDTFRDLWQSDDAKYMQIVLTGVTDIGGTNYPTITILLNKIQVTGWEKSGGADELITENIDFKAFYNETDSQQSKITLQNVTGSYEAPAS